MKISDSAKTILCYGDSLTYGRIPEGERYLRSERWTSILESLLEEAYEVISEGLPGRTLVVEDPEKPFKTGITHLKAILRSHKPIDIVVVMLGTNDTKDMYHLTISDIEKHLEQTIEMIQSENIKTIFVVSPPLIIQSANTQLPREFLSGISISKEFPKIYENVSSKYNCHFINSQEYILPSTIDGVHLDKEANKVLAQVLQEKIIKL